MQGYTTAEISNHNKKEDLWMSIHGYVFDLTKFSEKHPGGKKVLVNVAGKDATEKFDQFHNRDVLVKVGQEYCIGKLEEGKKIEDRELEKVEEKKVEEKKDVKEMKKVWSDKAFGELVPYGDPTWYQDWASPYYNESHRRFRVAIREFVDKEIMQHCHEWDEQRQIPVDMLKKSAQAGLLPLCIGLPFPKEYLGDFKLPGGISIEELDYFHVLIMYDELSRCGSCGVTWGISGGLSIGLPPIYKFASKYLKDKVVKPCLTGEKVICLAITEPSAGSDVANIKCEAKKTPDGRYYIVNGEKKWITNGIFADYFTVAVRTGGSGMGGISLLLIEKSMPGVKTTQMKCMGVWSSGTTYITFEDVKVPVENLIGSEDKGFKYIMYNFNHERWISCVGACRFARICLEESIRYGHKRKTFGKRLVDHPVIRYKMGQMARQIEATWAWIESITYQMEKLPKTQQDKVLGGPIALCKAQCTQVFEYCAREAAQIFGGLAYTRGGQGEKVERLYREVRAYAIPAGSEEIMIDLGVRQALKSSGGKF